MGVEDHTRSEAAEAHGAAGSEVEVSGEGGVAGGVEPQCDDQPHHEPVGEVYCGVERKYNIRQSTI